MANANTERLLNRQDANDIIETLGDVNNSIKKYSEVLAKSSFSSMTNSELVTAISALDRGEITTKDLAWEVGDMRYVYLNAIAAGEYNVAHAAQRATLVIMDVGPYNGTGHYVIGFLNSLIEPEKMEASNINTNGWRYSRGRHCCDAIFSMIPSDIAPAFKTFTVYAPSKGGTGGSEIVPQEGKLSLFSVKEVWERYMATSTSVPGYVQESELRDSRIRQIKFYEAGHHSSKSRGEVDATGAYDWSWWTRSPTNSNGQFCISQTQRGYGSEQTNLGGANANTDHGFAPFGVI